MGLVPTHSLSHEPSFRGQPSPASGRRSQRFRTGSWKARTNGTSEILLPKSTGSCREVRKKMLVPDLFSLQSISLFW